MKFLASSIVVLFAALANEVLSKEARSNSKFLKFIEKINKFERLESVFLLKLSKEPCFEDKLIQEISHSLSIPVILGTEVSSFYLKGKFNENLLTIVQYDFNDFILQLLAEFLQHLRFCKIIFVLKASKRNDLELKSVFNFCWRNKMVNVVAVFEDFETSSTYFRYTNFGNFEIEEFIWNKKDSNVFGDQLQDLHGSTLQVLLGGEDPGVIISENINGEMRTIGFLDKEGI
ncbi:uncharacterized protein LOC129919675 isoform X2 [Episyrphus balteatus]|uniref:uncharacterized protein LOC129919675 isoform X2 n=1 Tax=Episyrphus balteatus TaxID=286459 RepID=UPI0024857341|nr:uncharacterized protein LOC129919675 isoform X2 [Episyrphus balteatus]